MERCRSRAAGDDPPDASLLTVATGVGQWYFVVTDDRVVEVGDVQRPIGPQLHIDRAEPAIVASHKVGLGIHHQRRAMLDEFIAMHLAIHRVTQVQALLKLLGELKSLVPRCAADAGRAVAVIDHVGAEAHAVVRLPKAGVVGPAQQERQRHGVAVRCEGVAPVVEAQTERIDLPPGELLDGRTINAEAVGVPGVECQRLAILPLDM